MQKPNPRLFGYSYYVQRRNHGKFGSLAHTFARKYTGIYIQHGKSRLRGGISAEKFMIPLWNKSNVQQGIQTEFAECGKKNQRTEFRRGLLPKESFRRHFLKLSVEKSSWKVIERRNLEVTNEKKLTVQCCGRWWWQRKKKDRALALFVRILMMIPSGIHISHSIPASSYYYL